MNQFKTTIVTVFVDIHKLQNDGYPHRNCNYITESSKFLLQLSAPMIIFVEKHNADKIKYIRSGFGYDHLTRIQVFEFEKLQTSSHIQQLEKLYEMKKHKNTVFHYSPHYVATVNAKQEFLKIAMRLTTTGYLMWLDFGIGKRDYDITINGPKILYILSNPKQNISYAIISPKWNSEDKDGFLWIAAGGLITVPNTLETQIFLDYWQTTFVKLLQESVYPLEEYILFKFWKEHPRVVDVFYANYNILALKYYGNFSPEEAKKKRQEVLLEQS